MMGLPGREQVLWYFQQFRYNTPGGGRIDG